MMSHSKCSMIRLSISSFSIPFPAFFSRTGGESELWAENNQSPENALAVYRDNAFHCIWIDAKNGEIRIMFEETEEQLSQKCAANHKKQMFNEDMRRIFPDFSLDF